MNIDIMSVSKHLGTLRQIKGPGMDFWIVIDHKGNIVNDQTFTNKTRARHALAAWNAIPTEFTTEV